MIVVNSFSPFLFDRIRTPIIRVLYSGHGSSPCGINSALRKLRGFIRSEKTATMKRFEGEGIRRQTWYVLSSFRFLKKMVYRRRTHSAPEVNT